MKIEHIAMLARLELTEEENRLFSKQIDNILKYIEKLNEIDTMDIEPTSHVLSMKNVFREDNVVQSLPKDRALQNAPATDGSFYKVPKIIE